MLDRTLFERRPLGTPINNPLELRFFYATKDVFSQWHKSAFVDMTPAAYNETMAAHARQNMEFKPHVFSSAEQYMMWRKARLFGDEIRATMIMQTKSPTTIKELGRVVRGFDQAVWDAHKYNVVLEGNRYKFLWNQDMMDELLRDPDRDVVFVEASPTDTVWGIGMRKSARDAHDPTKWRGQNMLGFVLTELRCEMIGRQL